MDISISEGAPAAGLAAPGTDGTAPAAPVAVQTSIRIEGKDRPARSLTIGGRTIIYTDRLTANERRQLSRAMLPGDVEAPEAYGLNQLAAKVRNIDGAPIAFPSNDVQIGAILDEAGDDFVDWVFAESAKTFREKLEAEVKNSKATAS